MDRQPYRRGLALLLVIRYDARTMMYFALLRGGSGWTFELTTRHLEVKYRMRVSVSVIRRPGVQTDPTAGFAQNGWLDQELQL